MGLPSKIIGGMFGLEAAASVATERTMPAALLLPHNLYATARSAIRAVVTLARPRQVWFPSFLCESMLQAIAPGAAQIRFFPVDNSLHITDEAWLGDIKPGDVAVFIDYFGFRTWDAMGARAKARGAVVVEDASQNFLARDFCPAADFIVFSPRKFFGVADGGILAARAPDALPPAAAEPPPAGWWQDALRAAELRLEFDRHGGQRTWFGLFQKKESEAPAGDFAMSEVSRTILHRAIDFAVADGRRTANYHLLAQALGEFALFPELAPATVPLGFPVRVPERDRVRQTLFAADIFPPVHWPIQGAVPEQFAASHQLAREIMTLPCDQRYELADMRRVADSFLAAI